MEVHMYISEEIGNRKLDIVQYSFFICRKLEKKKKVIQRKKF